MKKYIILVASIVFILSISAVSAGLLDGLFDGSNTPINSNEKAEFKIYGYAPMPVEKQLDIIKKKPGDFNNNETRDWLKTINNYLIYDTGHEFIVMNKTESEKIPVIDNGTDLNDVQYNLIKCTVVESHSLGSGFKNCILVKDVEVIGNTSVKLNRNDHMFDLK